MIRRFSLTLLLTGLIGSACAPGPSPAFGPPGPGAVELWSDAHEALRLGDFDAAESHFRTLSEEHPDNQYGREALFYLGVISLDPRNPEWDAEPVVETLGRYLAGDTAGTRVNRAPEARIVYELARQFTIPADQRITSLQPETRVVRAPANGDPPPPPPADADVAREMERLRQQVAERDETIRAQQAELERIRRTLVPPDGES